jgi:hypothetical protein
MLVIVGGALAASGTGGKPILQFASNVAQRNWRA